MPTYDVVFERVFRRSIKAASYSAITDLLDADPCLITEWADEVEANWTTRITGVDTLPSGPLDIAIVGDSVVSVDAYDTAEREAQADAAKATVPTAQTSLFNKV